jgi:colanic acid biosynthesis glycosyl transferase WcaI
MRLIFLNRFFAPDHSATAQLLSDLAFGLSEAGHTIQVIASRRRYDDPKVYLPARETIRNVEIYRVWSTSWGRDNLALRALDFATFYATAFFRLLLLARRDDIIVAKTDPPLIAVVAAPVALLRGGILVNWFQDVFPEAAEATGVAGRIGKVLFRLARSLRNWSIRRASLNVALGEHMAERLRREGAHKCPVVVIPNWADGGVIYPVAASDNSLRLAWNLDEEFVVGYSGNLGRVHELDALLTAMSDIAGQDFNGPRQPIAFLFIGGGAHYPRLHQEIARRQLKNVHFKPYQPAERLAESLSVPDVHLISLRPQFEGLVVPSKLYGILAAGRPAIFIGDDNGEVARCLRRADCGFTVRPSEGRALAKHITGLADNPKRAAEMGRRARSSFEAQFDKRIAVAAWTHLLLGASARQPARSPEIIQASHPLP